MNEREKEKLILQMIKFFGKKKVYQDVESAKKELKKQESKNKASYDLPFKFRKFADKKVFERTKTNIFEYFVKEGDNRAIIYIHGGAFCSRPIQFHWQFLEDIARKTGATVYVPLYPLSPKAQYKDTYDALLKFYQAVAKEHKKVFIMGDSAGGTLTLGLTNLIREEELILPKSIFVMSPVVDMSFSNEDMVKFEKYDPMLSRDGCKFICQKWAGDQNLDMPCVNPVKINYNGFPDLYLFYGTYEIFCPDLRLFVKQLEKSKVNFKVFEEAKMYHTYPLFPIPKADKARAIMCEVINKKK